MLQRSFQRMLAAPFSSSRPTSSLSSLPLDRTAFSGLTKMMKPRKIRLLGLHGKGTSARIMKTQIKPITDALIDILEIDFLDGGHASSPYQGIESVFPKEAYYSWYEQPTAAALYSAHSRVADRLLISTGYNASKEFAQQMVTNNNSLESNALGVYSPPETPTLFTPAFAAPDMTVYRPLPKPPALSPSSTESVMTSSRDVAQRRLVHLVTGLDTPDSYPSTASPRTPMDAGVGPYDGLICFSQGCAVSTGLLLRLGAKFGYNGALPVRFVILICGGRPFDSKGTMERVEAADVAPIEISSIHIQGRKDPGLEESKRLASLYSESGKQVIELDIGHCPPRRTSDVCTVASAIRKAIAQLA